MKEQEKNILAKTIKKYLTIHNKHKGYKIFETGDIPKYFDDIDVERKRKIRELKKHIEEMKKISTNPYMISSMIERQFQEMETFISDLRRVLYKHESNYRMLELVGRLPHELKDRKAYYTINATAKLLGFKPAKIREFCKNGTIECEDWAKKSKDYEKRIANGEKVNSLFMIPHHAIFGYPFYASKDNS